jgi:hypothetical protein
MSLLLSSYKKHLWWLDFWLCVCVHSHACTHACLWDRQTAEKHYTVKDWPAREDYVPENMIFLMPPWWTPKWCFCLYYR